MACYMMRCLLRFRCVFSLVVEVVWVMQTRSSCPTHWFSTKKHCMITNFRGKHPNIDWSLITYTLFVVFLCFCGLGIWYHLGLILFSISKLLRPLPCQLWASEITQSLCGTAVTKKLNCRPKDTIPKDQCTMYLPTFTIHFNKTGICNALGCAKSRNNRTHPT